MTGYKCVLAASQSADPRSYFIFQCALLCFEISIFTVVVGYWKVLNPAILSSVLIFTYFILNVWTAALFGGAHSQSRWR